MMKGTCIKYFYWCFMLLILWNKLQILTINAAHIETKQNYILAKHVTVNNSDLVKQIERHIEEQSQASSSKTQTFLELLLGIIDTLQFGKRKIGTPS